MRGGSRKGRRTKTTLSAEQEAEIVREYWEGRLYTFYGKKSEIARRHGVSRQTVHAVLKRCQIDMTTGAVRRIDDEPGAPKVVWSDG